MPKYRIKLDIDVYGSDEEDAILWLQDHIDQPWEVQLNIEELEEDSEYD